MVFAYPKIAGATRSFDHSTILNIPYKGQQVLYHPDAFCEGCYGNYPGKKIVSHEPYLYVTIEERCSTERRETNALF
jgi:hypothetical protein